MQAGQVVGVEAPPNGANATFEARQVPLNTPLRLRATLKLPDLPKQDGKYLGGAVALGGGRHAEKRPKECFEMWF